jgi:hypothetical protein
VQGKFSGKEFPFGVFLVNKYFIIVFIYLNGRQNTRKCFRKKKNTDKRLMDMKLQMLTTNVVTAFNETRTEIEN